ncbi:hypothetical protein GCM10009534_05210 [Kribbella sandramycini]
MAAAVACVVTLLVAAVGGRWFVKDVVGWVGGQVGHDELTLRLLGWAWVGVPMLVISALLWFGERVPLPVRKVVGATALAIGASSAMLRTGHRGPSEEQIFGEVWADAQPLSYGWGAAAGTVLAMFGVMLVVYLIAGKVAGSPLPPRPRALIGKALWPVWIVLVGLGIWLAVAGRMPS